MKRFLLKYDHGNQVYEGVQFTDGAIALRATEVQHTGVGTTATYKSLDDLKKWLSHGELTWIDKELYVVK